MTAAPAPTALRPMTPDQCQQVLEDTYVGRLAYVQAGRPLILPVNYVYTGEVIVFRTGTGLLGDVIHDANVAFEIDGYDVLDHTGWSVVVQGLAEEVWQRREIDVLRQLPLRPWAPGERERWMRITPTVITGRRIGV